MCSSWTNGLLSHWCLILIFFTKFATGAVGLLNAWSVFSALVHGSCEEFGWHMGWIPKWGSPWKIIFCRPFDPRPPPVSVLFSLLWRNEVSTFWPFFFLSFIRSVNSFLGTQSFLGLVFNYQWLHVMCVLLWLCYLTQIIFSSSINLPKNFVREYQVS